METKTVLLILVALVIAGIGYVAFMQKAPTEEAPTDTASQGKLDINVVCEGALAYMSFPDGASAETFVAQCKEGKHPEVIEQYKAQMNLGDGAQI